MSRYNIFNQIHKGLRAMLYETALKLQHTDFQINDDAETTIAAVESALHIFHTHAHHEDSFVLPAIQSYEPALVQSFEDEHVMDDSLAEQVSEKIGLLKSQTTDSGKISAGYDLVQSFQDFIAFNLYHMNKEEDKINKVLWAHYSDNDLMQITHQIIENIPPAEMEIESVWMMKGLNNTEITNWLKTVKQGAPEFVFRQLLSQAEQALPLNRWNKVQESMTDGAMIA
jgi:hypothetical protein